MNDMTGGPTIQIDRVLSAPTAAQIAAGKARIAVADGARQRCADAFERLEQVVAENRHVYGVTTGFGPLANRIVDARHAAELQQNLVYHLATGVGAPFDWETARAIVLARIMTLVQGASGARLDTLDRLVSVLNAGLAPALPERGTVGASGDLTPLAHLVLCL
ncbi:MAG: aromatic amino acid lyase, partial [Pseudomonadota bacterium]